MSFQNGYGGGYGGFGGGSGGGGYAGGGGGYGGGGGGYGGRGGRRSEFPLSLSTAMKIRDGADGVCR
jgi:hypothetical protein